MGAKQLLLRQAEQEYDGLKAAIKGLEEVQMSTVWLGSWGVREIVAHISGWHREMIPALERLHRGEAPYPDGAYDEGKPASGLVDGVTAGQYREHAEQIRQWRQR